VEAIGTVVAGFGSQRMDENLRERMMTRTEQISGRPRHYMSVKASSQDDPVYTEKKTSVR
jgi:hypothetical protein